VTLAGRARAQGQLRELIALLPEDSPRRAAAAAALGAALAAASRPEDAAVALLAAGAHAAALEQYCLAGEWRMALALAGARGGAVPQRVVYGFQPGSVNDQGGWWAMPGTARAGSTKRLTCREREAHTLPASKQAVCNLQHHHQQSSPRA